MRVLAIDTALEACAAAVLDTEQAAIVASESLPMVRGHAEALMPLIARVMDRPDSTFAALDRIAVTTGPGSFTGLRVGISAARGIALAAGKPAFGLTTLAAYRRAADRRRRHAAGRGRDRCAARARLSAGVRARRPHAGRAAHRSRCARRCARRRPARRASSAPAPSMLAAAWPAGERAADAGRCSAARPTSTGSRGSAPPRSRPRVAAEAALSARARRAAAGRRAGCRADDRACSPRLFARGEPVLSEAAPRDAAAIAALHAASFRRGWSEQRIRAACCSTATWSRIAP